jgi:Ni,Fe-hydrogenase III large subunit/NADH:ubiquinone oxidoreductase subunit C
MKGAIEKEISSNELMSILDNVKTYGDRMQMAYAWYPDEGANPEVVYVATMGSQKPFHLWRCPVESEMSLPSSADLYPLLGWYEREIMDLFGITFLAHPESVPLVLHSNSSSTLLTPMHPNYKPEDLVKAAPWALPVADIEHEHVQLLPFGPIRAGVCESVQFMYLYAGESILQFYERLFFKHRGMEKRFEGLSPELGVILSERVSCVSSVAHALAFSQAVEIAADCEISSRAKVWRVILAELERIYNHVSFLGHLSHTTTLKVAEAQGKALEEWLKQLNAKVTGSRFLREIITPGGLRREPDTKELSSSLRKLKKDILKYTKNLSETNTFLDRLIGTGTLPEKIAFDQGATGPVCRASGIRADFRYDHPYAAYDQFSFLVPVTQRGDAYSRMAIRILEIEESFNLIESALTKLTSMPSAPIRVDYKVTPNMEGLGWAESPRGGLFYAVHFNKEGRLARVKIKTPSFSNWRVFPFTVNDTNMMDFAINEASFGSTVAGCDR